MATNGKEGIQCFNLAMEENEPYDLVCLDIVMPEVDGKLALEEIRRMEGEVGIKGSAESKVLTITSLDDPKTVIECFRKGATAYLVKPVEHEKPLKQLAHLSFFELMAEKT